MINYIIISLSALFANKTERGAGKKANREGTAFPVYNVLKRQNVA
jgi:hypothetical protein